MMLSNADFDELFATQGKGSNPATRRHDTAAGVTDAQVAVPPLSTPQSAQANAALATVLAAAMGGATWAMLSTFSRFMDI